METTTLAGTISDIRRVSRGHQARRAHLDSYRSNRQTTPAKSQTGTFSDVLVRSHTKPTTQPQITEPVASDVSKAQLPVVSQQIQPSQPLMANLAAVAEYPLTYPGVKDEILSNLHDLSTVVVGGLSCIMLVAGIFTFVWQADSQAIIAQPVANAVIEVEASTTSVIANNPALPDRSATSPGRISAHQPTRLNITSLGLSGKIETVGLIDGKLEMPRSYGLAGWLNTSSVLGSSGPTVLVGSSANGALFNRLTDVKNGELITVSNGKGQHFTYRVTKKTQYAKAELLISAIMKSGGVNRLELIGSQSSWQAGTDQLVVTAELVQ
jgi:hypothetical protein